MQKDLQKSGIDYLLRVGFQVVIGLILFLVASGTLTYLRGWIYFVFYLTSTTLGVIYLSKHNPEVFNERAKKRDNTEQWDKVLLTVYVVFAIFVIYIIAGLDIRFGWSHIPIIHMYPAIGIVVISSVLMVWAMKENANFEATSRVQSDRIQVICDSGPYGIVRHPGYLSIVLWATAIPFVFGSMVMIIPSSIILVVIVVRTYLEDKMLKEKLEGYLNYSNKVKYRLIPFIW